VGQWHGPAASYPRGSITDAPSNAVATDLELVIERPPIQSNEVIQRTKLTAETPRADHSGIGSQTVTVGCHELDTAMVCSKQTSIKGSRWKTGVESGLIQFV
jgi:hypothetical protein